MIHQAPVEEMQERSLPSVNDARPRNGRLTVTILFIALVLIVGGGVTYWGALRIKTAVSESAAPKQKEEQSAVRKKTFESDASAAAAASLPASQNSGAAVPAPSPEMTVPAIRGNPSPQPPPIGVITASGNTKTSPAPNNGAGFGKEVSPYDSPFVVNGGEQPGVAQGVLARSGNSLGESALAALTANAGGTGLGSGMGSGGSNSPDIGKGTLTGMLTPTNTPTVRAGTIGDRNLMAAKGTMIDCVLTTKIVAMLPGMVKCKLTRNLYSANGKVVLAERGSEVTGEQSGTMKQGQTRLYVLWSRIVTPQGVTINIDSPGTDALGAAGVDGDVDNRWAQRIGGALVLSVVQDIFAYEIARQQNTSGNQSVPANTAYLQTTQTGEKIVEKVLESTINIPPTLYKNQGERISIFIARDVDFSAIYELQAK